MFRMYFRISLSLVLSLMAGSIFAQSTSQAASTIPTINRELNIDGQLDEAEWNQALMISRFITIRPDNDSPARYQTEVRLLSTATGLYVGSTNYQPQDSRVKRVAARDQGDTGDLIRITLDTSGTGRYGYYFELLAGGSINDGTILPERVLASEWDAPIQAKTTEDSTAWYGEMLIPWSVLQLPNLEGANSLHSMGISIERLLAQANEWVAYPAISPNRPVFLTALPKVSVEAQTQLDKLVLYPYVSVIYDELNSDSEVNTGTDLYWQPKNGLQLSATINPDFGQVENDEIIVNFSAEETFFPEKRSFFLENREIFESNGVNLVHTKRIGAVQSAPDLDEGQSLVQDTLPVDIIAAGKLVGQSGQWRYGVMAAAEDDTHFRLDSGEPLDVSGSDFFANRLLYEHTTPDNSQWALGYLATLTRNHDSQASVLNIDNRWRSANGRFLFDSNWIFSHRDQDGEESSSGFGFQTQSSYTSRSGLLHRFRTRYYDKDLDINDLGFLPRNNLVQLFYRVAKYWENTDAFQRMENEFRFFFQSNTEGELLDTNIWVVGVVTFNNLHSLGWLGGFDNPDYVDRLSRGNGSFKKERSALFRVNWRSDTSKNFYHYHRFSYDQEDLGGDGYLWETELTVVPVDNLSLMTSFLYHTSKDKIIHVEDNRLDGYRFKQYSWSVNGNWNISPKQELRLGMQWVAVDAVDTTAYRIVDERLVPSLADPLDQSFSSSDLVFQLRYKYEFAPLSDLFIVYGRSGFSDTGADLDRTDPDHLFKDALDTVTSNTLTAKLRFRW